MTIHLMLVVFLIQRCRCLMEDISNALLVISTSIFFRCFNCSDMYIFCISLLTTRNQVISSGASDHMTGKSDISPYIVLLQHMVQLPLLKEQVMLNQHSLYISQLFQIYLVSLWSDVCRQKSSIFIQFINLLSQFLSFQYLKTKIGGGYERCSISYLIRKLLLLLLFRMVNLLHVSIYLQKLGY